MYRQASVLNRSGKNYLCTCLAEFLQIVDKVIKLLRTQKLHLYEHRILSCHTIALYDILHTLNKRIKLFLLYRLQVQIDKGFYFIALKAQVPIVLIGIDYSKKTISATKAIMPSGDINKDMREIKLYFKDFKGKHPENFALGEI